MFEILSEWMVAVRDFEAVPLLLVRLVVAIVFFVAVRNKLKDVPAFAEHNGLSVPIAWGLITAELAGAVGFALGMFTQVAALVIMGTMLGSMTFHIFRWKSPYWAASGGWEYDLMIFAMAAVVFTVGGGGIELWSGV